MLDLQQIQKDSEYAIKRLELANEVAGGTRMGTQEDINVLKQIPALIDLIHVLMVD